MKKTVKRTKHKKRANTSRGAAVSATVPRDASKPAMVDLYRAAETLAAGKGHKAIDAARQMLETAAALGVITLTGESENVGIGGTVWTVDSINKFDYSDIEFRWNDKPGDTDAQAVHVAPSGDQTVYRRLRMREADLQTLGPQFEPWLAATVQERSGLAHKWWGPAIDPRLVQPSEEERFWLPLLAARLPIVSAIAEHSGGPTDKALYLLDKVLKEVDRTSGIEVADRQFLIGLSGIMGTDVELIRLDRLVRGLLLSQFRGDPNARLRVLRLFDPDVKDAASANPEIVSTVQRALTLPLVSEPIVPAGKEAAAMPGRPAESEEQDKKITAIGRFLRNGERGVSWQVLCDGVRDICDGWDDPKSRAKKPKPGYSDKTIRRLATPIMGKARSQNGR
jgi:hypothetical protein